ncbi:MAG: hypothetical protein RLZZ227_13, partial [Pseudomonadota bacterium]
GLPLGRPPRKRPSGSTAPTLGQNQLLVPRVSDLRGGSSSEPLNGVRAYLFC